jgi:hypothetical protein
MTSSQYCSALTHSLKTHGNAITNTSQVSVSLERSAFEEAFSVADWFARYESQ